LDSKTGIYLLIIVGHINAANHFLTTGIRSPHPSPNSLRVSTSLTKRNNRVANIRSVPGFGMRADEILGVVGGRRHD
jgi:hypothetical protein